MVSLWRSPDLTIIHWPGEAIPMMMVWCPRIHSPISIDIIQFDIVIDDICYSVVMTDYPHGNSLLFPRYWNSYLRSPWYWRRYSLMASIVDLFVDDAPLTEWYLLFIPIPWPYDEVTSIHWWWPDLHWWVFHWPLMLFHIILILVMMMMVNLWWWPTVTCPIGDWYIVDDEEPPFLGRTSNIPIWQWNVKQ